ncbi:MAG: complex I NDUFA9 subunit family protein [Proteobacteria bacterium]|nr:complex I NDUFA9 subunit family protein [Pseudomonadota bacterium]
MKLQTATIAVIGGSGFIGRQIVEKLARAGARLKILTRNADKAKFLRPMGAPGQITLISGKATDDKALAQVLAGVDAVVNTVGILAEGGGQRFAALQADLPARIGQIMAKAETSASPSSRPHLPRIIHLSAIGADPQSPSRYARTKAAGEAGLLAAFPKATILRPSLVFGAGDGFFNRFAAMAVTAPALPVIGGGTNRIQPVYVGDVANAVVAALQDQTSMGKTYELGGPEIITFREAMRFVLQSIGRSRMLMSVPFPVMGLAAMAMSILPNPPVTRDQLKLLKSDNVVSADALGFAELGLTPTGMALIVPKYLERYKPGGRFSIT